MLKSLFGELSALRDPQDVSGPRDFAATAILESTAAEVNERGQMVDRHIRDLFVTGSPAQAMRQHVATLRDEMSPGTRLITLFDPARMWAGAVVKALSDASGQPIERLHLRDQGTLGTLAMIERTTLPRRLDDTLKIYHADVRGQGDEAIDIPLALMERCDLTCVVVGPMQPAAIDDMLETLRRAATASTWRCPHLLFLLPVGAIWIGQKVQSVAWPRSVRIDCLAEPLTSASAVWNALLAHWNRIKPGPGQATPAADWADGFPIRVADIGAAPGVGAATEPGRSASAAAPSATAPAAASGAAGPVIAAAPVTAPLPDSFFGTLNPAAADPRPAPLRRAPDPARAAAVLAELMRLDGLLFTALVDAGTGLVVASQGQGGDIDRAAAAATDVLRAHRRTLRHLGHTRATDPIDEVLVTAGNRYHVLRGVQGHPDHFILAVLDKLRTNLAMTRFRILEAQQALQ